MQRGILKIGSQGPGLIFLMDSFQRCSSRNLPFESMAANAIQGLEKVTTPGRIPLAETENRGTLLGKEGGDMGCFLQSFFASKHLGHVRLGP